MRNGTAPVLTAIEQVERQVPPTAWTLNGPSASPTVRLQLHKALPTSRPVEGIRASSGPVCHESLPYPTIDRSWTMISPRARFLRLALPAIAVLSGLAESRADKTVAISGVGTTIDGAFAIDTHVDSVTYSDP